MDRKRRVEAAFSAAAATYDSAALAQARAADLLAAALPALPPTARVLELGCGTGLLTRRLLERLPTGASLLATDLSPAMVEATARLDDPRLTILAMDAERPAPGLGGFDLIASSLAAQWFDDLGATLTRLAGLLAPGGSLLLATLGSATFKEWRVAHAAQGLLSGVPDYPEADALAALLPGATVERHVFTQDYADARAFLAALDAIGARTPRPGHRPLTPGRLRRIMAGLGSPCAVTWDILLLSHTRSPA
ncbi:SAM-dependent methyltransferase [Paramagnetospirillum marisnigri]|uniref:SAM-dependent methyltransferase n=1 Tax=Paramagnetospirillum marisnigri TaxID=1285242 RepID=A0A178M4D4_9PROT|nr:methyltransferase domain-containing protein [Paramagnetospirillum marisnigri]OAN42923.1 SAM-dependent methyltransferase [Paramagnetospirillum marisnigri]